MHDFPRQKLFELINYHGTALCDEPKRCEAWLQDMCADKKYKREVFALVNALKQRVAVDLLEPPRGLPIDALFNRLVQRLYDNVGLDKKVAIWAVQSWGMALGVKVSNQPKKVLNKALLPSTIITAHPKRFSKIFNPFDMLRLLWWVLVIPRQLLAYRHAFGEVDEKRIGKWLVSTLTWWPLLLPILALGLELMPHFTETPPETYIKISIVLFGSWLLTGWLGNEDEENVTAVVVAVVATIIAAIVAIFVSVDVASFVSGGVVFALAIVVANSIAGMVALGILLAGGIAFVVAFGIMTYVFIMVDSVANVMVLAVIGFVVIYGVSVLARLVGNAISISLKTGIPSQKARFAFLLLVVAHLFLIGFCFFDGWQLFVSNQ